jgi:hypothetical protein
LTAVRDASTIARMNETRQSEWQAPSFVEIRMDCEINSYQDDFAGRDDFDGSEV